MNLRGSILLLTFPDSVFQKKTVCTINLIEFLNKLTLGFYHSEPSKTVCNIKDTISLFFRHIQMSRS
jgi:hypothetical protein